jgi:DNA (cytosine-5)-methyltransferase 1
MLGVGWSSRRRRQLSAEPTYLEYLALRLRRPDTDPAAAMVYDLFAGCGGLALGFEAAGFRTKGFEIDRDACASYRSNLAGECIEVNLHTASDLGEAADVLIGGPPCQPFSVGGLQGGRDDPRNGFPTFLAAVDRYRPRLALFENVRGMFYRNRHYLEEIVESLKRLDYVVDSGLFRAVQFGVPQTRERLVVVAHRGGWMVPQGLGHQYTAGDAVGTCFAPLPRVRGT